jgi:hypothetical protein
MSYIKSTQFFNTGFVPETENAKRLRQGLQSQFISNLSLDYMKQMNQENLPSFNTLYYPVKATPLPTYGLKPIGQDRPCVFYLQPP